MKDDRPSRNLRSALLRFAILILLIGAGLLVIRWTPLGEWLTRDTLVASLSSLRVTWWAPLLLVGLFALFAPLGIPVSPLILAGGLVFGVRWGWLYNFLGMMSGATVSFLLANALGRDLVVNLAGETLLQRVEGLLARHGFWTLVRIRFLPLPFVMANFGAAFAGYPLSQFLSASALGLAPSMLIYTYFGYALATVATAERQAVVWNLIGAVALVLLLTFLVPLRQAWKRRRYGKD